MSTADDDRSSRERFGVSDSNIRFKDADGNVLSHDQVRKMQADAEAEEARIAAHEAEMELDQREQAEARKGR